MKIESITTSDLDEIKELQPADWPDIVTDISYYIRSGYCYPIKFCTDGIIAGIGAVIIYNSTAWLAHIIVRANYRKNGIGSAIVKELLNISNKNEIKSKLLNATSLGEPVYLKAGFRKVTEYLYFSRIQPFPQYNMQNNTIQKSDMKHFYQILDIDKKVTGEDRGNVLHDFASDAMVCLKGGHISGYYFPSLKEGPIVALDTESGIELMKFKYQNADRAALPRENIDGIDFLMKNGFHQSENKGIRMLLGDEIKWEPDKIFSRIGGNFG